MYLTSITVGVFEQKFLSTSFSHNKTQFYLLTPEPNGVIKSVYGLGRVLRRRRRRRDTVYAWTLRELGSPNLDQM